MGTRLVAGMSGFKRRQWFQERNFAEASTQHGYKRSRWRGLWRQTIQDQIIATLQNLKILIRNLFSAWCELWCELLAGLGDLTRLGYALCKPAAALTNIKNASRIGLAVA